VPTSTIPPFFTGWMPLLPPNQQCQSPEGKAAAIATSELIAASVG